MKKCSKCSQLLDTNCFTKDRTTSDGLYSSCRECKRKNSKQLHSDKHKHKAKLRAKKYRESSAMIRNVVKTYTGCVVCGENTHPGVLELHHLDPNVKEFAVSENSAMSVERLVTEIAKCICLCANCHRKVHMGLVDITTKHPLTNEEIYSIIDMGG